MAGYSLHIGLNRVDPNAYGGWDGALGGCVNDAHSMQQLASSAGFGTTMLIDGQATSQAVIGEIALLAQRACPGDICLVTYSGHGGQVDDFNADEDDAQDETWVVYDRQVVDDELFQMWSQFASGVRVLVLSDSCHSGTVLRSMIATKGRDALAETTVRESGVSPLSVVTTPKHMPFDAQYRDNEQRRGTYQFVQALSGPRAAANVSASVLLISGCQDNQLSYDGPVNGQFTGTLLRVWSGGAFSGDYTALHAAILAQMPPDQSPNLYSVGPSDPAFLGQRPFTVAPPAGAPTPPNGLPPTGDVARPVLREGASGQDVVYLQQRLNAYGASLTADGFFGPMTTAAVRSFQSSHGLTADGVVGPMTWNALGTAPVGGGSSTPSPGNGVPQGGGGVPQGGGGPSVGGTAVVARPTIRRGSTGPDVQHLQSRLSSLGYWIAVDGVFGPGTESTVRSFQSSHGLPADGIVGPQTWAALG